jgi:putative membrane protein
MMHGWNPFMAFGSVWGVVWMLLLVAFAVWAAVAVTRALLPRSGGPDREPSDDALDVLRARYARGEIDEQEYRARLSTLTTSSGGRS